MCWARRWNEYGNNAQICLVKLLEKGEFENKAGLGE